MKTVLVIAAIAIALYLIDRAALAAERRGWIYYRHRKASPGTAPAALLKLQSFVDPAAERAIEAVQEEERDEDEAGEPPVKKRNGECGGSGDARQH